VPDAGQCRANSCKIRLLDEQVITVVSRNDEHADGNLAHAGIEAAESSRDTAYSDGNISRVTVLAIAIAYAERFASSVQTPAPKSIEPPAKLKPRCARREASNLRAEPANVA
jgi:hypothetical protein